MIIHMKILSIFCLAVVINLVPTFVFAQLDANSITNPELSIEIQPEFPRPGEPVTATLNDYNGGAYGSDVSWVLNGQELINFKNQRQAFLIAGTEGKQQVLEVVLSKPSGVKMVINKIIKPVYLDVVIEPQTRVPDFYLGRSLPSIGSIVNATALINGGSFRSSDLVYTWRINREVIEGGPIRGRNQVSFTTPIGSDSILSVQITEPSGAIVANRAIALPSVEPEIYFYEVSALFGVGHKPIIGDFSLTSNSMIVRAEPYNLDSRLYNNPTIHEWRVDNTPSTSVTSNPYEVTLQRGEGLKGTTNLQFHVRDTVQLLQGAKASMRINL